MTVSLTDDGLSVVFVPALWETRSCINIYDWVLFCFPAYPLHHQKPCSCRFWGFNFIHDVVWMNLCRVRTLPHVFTIKWCRCKRAFMHSWTGSWHLQRSLPTINSRVTRAFAVPDSDIIVLCTLFCMRCCLLSFSCASIIMTCMMAAFIFEWDCHVSATN